MCLIVNRPRYGCHRPTADKPIVKTYRKHSCVKMIQPQFVALVLRLLFGASDARDRHCLKVCDDRLSGSCWDGSIFSAVRDGLRPREWEEGVGGCVGGAPWGGRPEGAQRHLQRLRVREWALDRARAVAPAGLGGWTAPRRAPTPPRAPPLPATPWLWAPAAHQ